MENLYGSIDLTVLGKLVRQHPELVRKVNFKDGEHQMLNIDIRTKDTADQYGNVAFIKASCKKDNQKEGLNYFLANLKVSQFQQQEGGQHQQSNNASHESQAVVEDTANDLPF